MPQLYGPPPGSSCSTVSPDSRKDCCKTKVSETTDDSWCQEKYPEVGDGVVGGAKGQGSLRWGENLMGWWAGRRAKGA